MAKLKGVKFKSVATRIFAAFAVIMLLFAIGLYFLVDLAATCMNGNAAKDNLVRQASLVSQMLDNKHEGPWSTRDGLLFKGVYQMSDNNMFVDEIKESTGLNVTLFFNDTRVATNIVDAEGNRAVGTTVSPEVAEQVLAGGNVYTGQADVIGVINYTYYEPIRDPSDNIIGMFFIGLPADAVEKDLQRMTFIVFVAVVIASLLAIGVSYIIARRIGRQIRSAADTANQLSLGNTEIAISQSQLDGRDEIGVLMRSMHELVGAQKQRAQAALEISRGNLETNVEAKSEQDLLARSMQVMIKNLRSMAQAVQKLTAEAAAGNLAERGNASEYEGVYRDIVAGVNATLDAVTEPLSEADLVLGRLALSDASVPMSENYKGDFHRLADQINQVRDMFEKVETVCVRVAEGDFSLYPVLLDAAKDADEKNKLLPAMLGMIEAVQSMSSSAGEIAAAAGRGQLDYQADASAYKGAYAEVVNNLNQALQAMAAPLGEMEDVLVSVSEGNLTVRMRGEYEGSYNTIKQSINQTVESLRTIMQDIMRASEQVAASAGEISNASGALSQGSTEQASSIEELSASITQIAAQTRQNASNATSANQLSQRAHDSVQTGNDQMREMVGAMQEISNASANIAKIIKVIDDIAFQTNILALNAAVEAARAGQHGKGFAVVAEEVRNLAARSAEAARETTQYIESTLAKVESGSMTAKETEKSLVEIVEAIDQTTALVAEIANASNEQASGIGQINQGIDQVSVVVQTNSATSEETASTSELLSEQAKHLHESISSFRLE
ncbi:MAG: methyl-accepting chemotaxis protein [Eubacteriales bacterium]|nr:methyl-accepting chemotaxis protein [Eubacteriales bacterium]